MPPVPPERKSITEEEDDEEEAEAGAKGYLPFLQPRSGCSSSGTQVLAGVKDAEQLVALGKEAWGLSLLRGPAPPFQQPR